MSDEELGELWNNIHWGKRNIVEEKGQELVKPINNEVNKKIAEEIAKRLEIAKRVEKEIIKGISNEKDRK